MAGAALLLAASRSARRTSTARSPSARSLRTKPWRTGSHGTTHPGTKRSKRRSTPVFQQMGERTAPCSHGFRTVAAPSRSTSTGWPGNGREDVGAGGSARLGDLRGCRRGRLRRGGIGVRQPRRSAGHVVRQRERSRGTGRSIRAGSRRDCGPVSAGNLPRRGTRSLRARSAYRSDRHTGQMLLVATLPRYIFNRSGSPNMNGSLSR